MNGGIKMPNWLTDHFLIIGMTLGLLIFLLIILLVPRHKKIKKDKPKPLQLTFLPELLEALGKKQNLVSVDSEHQRLKVVVHNIKQVDAQKLKSLDTPAILKGKELTLLIKHHTKDVLTYLKKEIGE